MKYNKKYIDFKKNLLSDIDIHLETNEGNSVKIVETNFQNKYFTLLGIVHYSDGHDEVRLFTDKGESDLNDEWLKCYYEVPEYPENYDNVEAPQEGSDFDFDRDFRAFDNFSLSRTEYARYVQFCKDHRHPDVNLGAIGVGNTLCFTPTSIGIAVDCECPVCNQKVNITDYGRW